MPVGSGTSNKAQVAPLATAYTATGTNIHASYPVTRLSDLAHPRRVVRSVDVTATTIVLDFTWPPPTLVAFSLEGHNFGQLLLEGNTTNTWASPAFSQVCMTDAVDRDTGRRKALLIPATAFSLRYLRLTPSVPDAAYYQLGAFGVWATLWTLSRNPAVPYEKEIVDTAPQLDYEGGGEDIGASAPVRTRLRFPVNLYLNDTEAAEQWRTICRLPRDRVWMWYENNDDLTQFYHVRRVSTVTITRERDNQEQFRGLELLEVV